MYRNIATISLCYKILPFNRHFLPNGQNKLMLFFSTQLQCRFSMFLTYLRAQYMTKLHESNYPHIRISSYFILLISVSFTKIPSAHSSLM